VNGGTCKNSDLFGVALDRFLGGGERAVDITAA
jgi:hypothetical protein